MGGRAGACVKKARIEGKTYLLHHLRGVETAIRLDLEIELVGLRVVVERLVVARLLLLFRVLAEWPLVPRVVLVPVGRVAEFVVRVVLEGDGRAW